MKPERFERELRYQTMLSLCHSLLKSGILSQADFDEAERCLRAKYQPIFTAARPQHGLFPPGKGPLFSTHGIGDLSCYK